MIVCFSATSIRTKWVSDASTFLELWLQYKIPRFGEDLFIEEEDMETPRKYICLLALVVFVGIAGLKGADGAGECGKSSPDREAWKLAPCATAAQNAQSEVSDSCCLQVKKLGQNPSCLCAVMLSNTAKSSGVDPQIAVTIPKRCNLADRPVGYKCGAYTLP